MVAAVLRPCDRSAVECKWSVANHLLTVFDDDFGSDLVMGETDLKSLVL